MQLSIFRVIAYIFVGSLAPYVIARPARREIEVTLDENSRSVPRGGLHLCSLEYSSDSSFARIPSSHFQLYGSAICGKSVSVSNPENGRSIVAPIVGVCDDCKGEDDIELSSSSFADIAGGSETEFPVVWEIVS